MVTIGYLWVTEEWGMPDNPIPIIVFVCAVVGGLRAFFEKDDFKNWFIVAGFLAVIEVVGTAAQR